MPRAEFPVGSLLAAVLGDASPWDVRRAVRRLRADGAPALTVSDEIASLARELAIFEVSRSPAVLDALPPLFWIEAGPPGGSDSPCMEGWLVEKRSGGLSVRAFTLASGQGSIPEMGGTTTIRFGVSAGEDDAEILTVRGLVAAVSLPGVMSQMGESAPILLMPAEPAASDAGVLRGLRLSVAISPGSIPT